MSEDGTGDKPPVNSQPDDTNDSGLRIDPSAYALAAVFGPVAFPPGMPDYQKAAILDRAELERDAAGDLLIDNRMNPDDPRRRQAKANDGDDDNLSQQLAQVVRNEREEREREEWARTNSTVGGVTMTGAEWSKFAERLRDDDDLRRRLIETFERRGATHDEAVSRVDRVKDVAEAKATPPSQRSEEQKQVLRQADSDPNLRQDLRTAKSAMDDATAPRSAVNSSFTTAARGEALPSTPAPAPAPTPIASISGPGF